MYSNHNGIRLEINTKEILEIPKYMEMKQQLPHSKAVSNKNFTREIRKYCEMKNEYIAYGNYNCVYIKKEKEKISNL